MCTLVCRVTNLNGKNLLMTMFGEFRQLVGRYRSYLLPRQDGIKSKI